MSLAWYGPLFETYKNPQVLEDYIKAYASVGMPDWPYDLDKNLKADRLLNDQLKQLFNQCSFDAEDATGPFGAPMELKVKMDGTVTLKVSYAAGNELSGTWKIKGDQICYRYPASSLGRDMCVQFYLDSEKSTDETKRYIQLDLVGQSKFAIECIKE